MTKDLHTPHAASPLGTFPRLGPRLRGASVRLARHACPSYDERCVWAGRLGETGYLHPHAETPSGSDRYPSDVGDSSIRVRDCTGDARSGRIDRHSAAGCPSEQTSA